MDVISTIDVILETDHLKKARLAWIMGNRSVQSDNFTVQIGNTSGSQFFIQDEYQIRNMHWDTGKGVNRSSRLCSTEYLSRLFEVAMRRVSIQLSLPYASASRGDAPKRVVDFFPNYRGGLLGTVSKPMKREGYSNTKPVNPDEVPTAYALATAGASEYPFQVPLQQTASMTLTNNITFDVSSRDMRAVGNRIPDADSQAVRSVDNRHITNGTCSHGEPDRNFKCGIYPRSLSPFLHGRTLLQGMSATLLPSEKGYPRRMPDALGDHVAFAALEQAMTRVGILDWRPDGVVNSKLENGPNEAADAQYDANDGQLFNIHVQGPAICSNWCGDEHSRSLVAGDKLFVAIVADCWVGCGDKTEGSNMYKHLPQEMQDVYNKQSGNSVVGGTTLEAAAAKRAEILMSFHKNPRQNGTFAQTKAAELLFSKLAGLNEMEVARTSAIDYNTNVSPHLLCNFRLKYVTSYQMVETSKLALNDDGGVALGPNGQWPSGSRLGLAFSRTQLAQGTPYDPEFDIWLDPDNTEAVLANTDPAAESELKEALKAYNSNPPYYAQLHAAHKEWLKATAADTAASTPDTQAAVAAALAKRIAIVSNAGDPNAQVHAQNVVQNLQHFRGPNADAALHEVVVGAWHVGTVLDTAASRGTGRGFASHKYDSASNLNVDIQWWSGDRLFKNFANKPGTGQDFRMRSIPLDFPAKRDIGPDGSSTTVAGTAGKGIFDGVSGANGGDARASAVMEARTTFPDPWDLPAAVPMVRTDTSATNYNADRDAFHGVGKQRGVWGGGNTRTGRAGPELVNATDAAVSDPGNKFAYVARPAQGNIIAHDP